MFQNDNYESVSHEFEYRWGFPNAFEVQDFEHFL